MLVIGPPASAAYYWENGVRARWLGSGIAGLGLSGPPTPAAVHRMLHGLDDDSNPRWPSAPRRRRLGHDLVFAAPKEVSLLWALGAADVSQAVQRAHDRAVDGAFGYLERHAALVRRGAMGDLSPTTGFLAAGFRHSQSRAGDPHLHTHAVVANAALGADGRWSSLDGRWLFAEARAAGALYQAGLRHFLTEQGLSLQWRVRPDGLGAVESIGSEVISEFSRRRRQLLAATAGGETRRPGRLVNLATRPPRSRPTGDWHERARRAGFDASRFELRRAASTNASSRPLGFPPAEAVLGDSGVTERRTLFTRRDVVRAIAARLPDGAPAEAIEAEADRILASSAVVQVTPPQGGIVRPRVAARYTTPELADLEDRIVASAARSPGAVAVVRARPGSSIDDLVSAVPADRDPVVALARSPTEARQIEAATGIETRLVDDGLPPGAPAIIVIPQADRVGSKTIARLLDRAAALGHTVVLLDGARRPAVLHGRDLLSRLSLGPAGREPAHQPDNDLPARRVARLSREGGSVTWCADPASRRQAAVEDWAAYGPSRARLEARRWADCDDLNRRARELVGPAGPSVRAGGREYCAGEPVVVRRSSPALGLTRGRPGTVVSVDEARHRLTILFSGSKRPVEVDARRVGSTVLAHAYATPTHARSAAAGAGPVFTLDPMRRPGPTAREVHHYLVTGPERAPVLDPDPLTRLAHALGPAPPTGPDCPPVADLRAERLLAAERLRVTLPREGGDPARLAAAVDDAREERDAARYWASRAVPGADERVARAEEGVRRSERASARLVAWIEDHHPELRELARLDTAIGAAVERVGCAAELLPSRDVVGTLGPPPEGPLQRRAWRAAAAELETAGPKSARLISQSFDRERSRTGPDHQKAATICLP